MTSDVTSFKEKIDAERTFFLELSPNRCAALTKYDRQGEFEIGLQRVGWSFYAHELNSVAAFIGVDLEYIERNCNPPIKWVSDEPTPADIAYWESKVATKYPY